VRETSPVDLVGSSTPSLQCSCAVIITNKANSRKGKQIVYKIQKKSLHNLLFNGADVLFITWEPSVTDMAVGAIAITQYW